MGDETRYGEVSTSRTKVTFLAIANEQIQLAVIYQNIMKRKETMTFSNVVGHPRLRALSHFSQSTDTTD